MAISDNVQTLLPAFAFGIILQAASGVFLIYFNGHGATIFQDGRRLVLLLFLFFAGLWAQIDFVNLLISSKSSKACQVTLVFSTISDQLARAGLHQFLLWECNEGDRRTIIMQAILGLRIIAGVVLVGFTRPEFAPVCVARTSVLPISIIVIALDFVIIGVLVIRALSYGMFRDLRETRSSTHREQSRALIMLVVGFLVWTGISVVMLLGIPTTLLILRTLLPSIGLFILIGIMAVSSRSLLLPREEQVTTPEATSPFVTPSAPIRDLFRNNLGNGSPILRHQNNKISSLFVINPSTISRDSPTVYVGSQIDTKGFTKLGEHVTIRAIGPSEPEQSEMNRDPGYRGSSGVFPSILAASSMDTNNGALAPQIKRSSVTTRSSPSFPPPAFQQKRSMFNWSKRALQPTVRSMGISQPIVTPNQDLQPFARMQTIDLATAAANERERREAAARRSRLVANRPAPYPPTLTPHDALRKSISVKRKEMPGRPQDPMPTLQSSGASGVSLDVNGSTTSASLSLGREEVRRRSPRHANGFDEKLSEKELSSLQRKQTIRLPSNPRPQNLTIAHEAGMGSEQTVMFMSDIVFDNLGMVKTIINRAPEMYRTSKRSNTSDKSEIESYTTPQSSGSLIHRLRPIRRNSNTDRVFFSSEPSPGHKRSKSGSSITTRKSILLSHPGSPTQLPPLPAPPTSAAKLTRILPNSTKSLTFDEKIELLFPAPPGLTRPRNRRSSVPSLPRVPSVFMSDTPTAQSPTKEERGRRASKRMTIASFGLQDLQAPGNDTKFDGKPDTEAQTYRTSANTYETLADEVGDTWIPGIPPIEVDIRYSVLNAAVQDTPNYNLRKSAFTNRASTESSIDDDATTYWGSILSEAPAVDLSLSSRADKPTVVQHGGTPVQGVDSCAIPPVSQINSNDGEEIIMVMLHPDEHRGLLFKDNRQSFFLDADQSLPGDATPTPTRHSGAAWHRRIGDELPTFSERRENSRPRKMPPPTPLLLNSKRRTATVIVRAPEPSPIDFPMRAIKEIQAQLMRFEEPNRRSVDSLRRIPDGRAEEHQLEDTHEDRFKLLENLEQEMGQQENHWQQMQTNLDRDSMSTIVTPQPPQGTVLAPISSRRSSRTLSQVASRRVRVRSGMSLRTKSQDSTAFTSTSSSDNSRASVWQQRLAEAQLEHLESTPALLRHRSLIFFSVSKAQLGSPTPPDSVASGTDSEVESNLKSENRKQFKPGKAKVPSLWQAPLISPKAAVGRLWNPPYAVTTKFASAEPPAKSIRPKTRPIQSALSISSRELWSRPHSSLSSRPVVGLWGSRLVRPRSIVTLRATQRPQRKSKRVTFLPDIVESPQPLPNKRDTLGIFKFPWGETSDSAVYQPAFNPAFFTGPILNAKLKARSRELEPEVAEYSASFFDDYDEADEDEIDCDSDDDFDETTLWEIASLLKSEDVPSTKSLFPPPRKIVEDYDEETDFESESENESPVSRSSPTQLHTQPLYIASRNEPKLWTSGSSSVSAPFTTSLPQPDIQTWQAYISQNVNVPSFKSQVSGSLPVVSSHDLWSSTDSQFPIMECTAMWANIAAVSKRSDLALPTAVNQINHMWTIPKSKAEPTTGLFTLDASRPIIRGTTAAPAARYMTKAPRTMTAQNLVVSSQNLWVRKSILRTATMWIFRSIKSSQANVLWAPKPAPKSLFIAGLFVRSEQRSDYRTTSASPAAINLVRKLRTSQAPLSRLTSNKLWNGGENLPAEHHWISESSIRPESPSVYSETSSDDSSPISDASSVKSNSTKASSLWGNLRSVTTPAWWDNESKKKPTESSAEQKGSPSIQVRKPPTTALTPVKESRVLASRDLWQARDPTRKTQVRKTRKPTTPETPVVITTKPTCEEHRPVAAVLGAWDDTSAGAIAAGEAKKVLSRPAATNVEWEAALSKAISQSRPQMQCSDSKPKAWKAALNDALPKASISESVNECYDVAVRHPVFFATSLVSNSSDVHPAAYGYVGYFDVAIRHPVFFAKSLISSAVDVHPAAIGYITLPEQQTRQRTTGGM